MNRIASFQINHDYLEPGLYVSRIDGDVVTYDVRMKRPNGGDYLTPKSLHTIEHLFATYARNSNFSENVIYVGPMGCRTGFYLLTRDMKDEDVIKLVIDSMNFISQFDGEIPGSTKEECGNYLEHDIENARNDALLYIKVLLKYTPDMLSYPEQCIQNIT